MDPIQEYINLYNQNFSMSKIAKIYKIDRHRLSDILKANNIKIVNKRKRKYLPNHDYFENIDSEIKAYMLGFIFADGNVYKNRIKIEIRSYDKNILEIFSKEIYNYNLVKTILKSDSEYAFINIFSEKMKNDLSKYSCVPNKSKILKFPNILKEYYNHFIRGLIDGDGFISYKSRTIGLLATNDINLNIKNILNEIGINSFIAKAYKQDINVLNELRVKNKNSLNNLIDYLYKDATIYLERKYINAIEIKKMYV